MRPENRALLGDADVILASHPGSGTSWLATLLVRLGIFYASGHDELLAAARPSATEAPGNVTPEGAGLSRPALTAARRARHLPALAARDVDPAAYREPLRVVSTNDSAFAGVGERSVVLLVRDGRDVLLSLYHHLCAFAGLDVTLERFLEGADGAWPRPALAWAANVSSWIGNVPAERLHLCRFESCRERPFEEFAALLRFLDVERSHEELSDAIAASSYDAMRRAEDERVGHDVSAPRYMRRGEVGEWRSTYTPVMLSTFRGLPERLLAHLGYPASAP